MSIKLSRIPTPRWTGFRLVAAVLAAVLLTPFVLVALLPMLIMFVPIAVVAIPAIAPVMLSGKLAARWEGRQRAARTDAAHAIKRAPVAVR